MCHMRSCLAAFWSIMTPLSILGVSAPTTIPHLMSGFRATALLKALLAHEALHVPSDGLLSYDGEVWTAVRLARPLTVKLAHCHPPERPGALHYPVTTLSTLEHKQGSEQSHSAPSTGLPPSIRTPRKWSVSCSRHCASTDFRARTLCSCPSNPMYSTVMLFARRTA